MKQRMTFIALVGLLTVVAGGIVRGPAGAATPEPVHQQVSGSAIGIEQCGFTVDAVVKGTLTFETFVDRSGNPIIEQDESHVVTTMTNEANHNVVYVDSGSRDRFDLVPVVNRDGSLTVTDTITGSPERVYTAHSNVLVKDVGLISVVDTLDSDGKLVDEQVIIHGVHEVSGPDAAYCAAITAALT